MQRFKDSKMLFLIGLGVLSRIVPHPANFTVVGGMAVYLGKTKQNMFIPLLSMLMADLILGFDSLIMRVIVYGSVAIMYLAGRLIKNLWLASILGSFMFFMITNIGVWLTSSMYEKTLWGLTQCLFMALPFWRNALVADALFAQAFKFGDILIDSEKTAGTLNYLAHASFGIRGVLRGLVFPGRKYQDR